MKKISLFTALAAVIFSFAACDSDSGSDRTTMNEDYAGTWYHRDDAEEYSKYDITDTNFELTYYLDDELDGGSKGTVKKESDGVFTLTNTHALPRDINDQPEWLTVDEAISLIQAYWAGRIEQEPQFEDSFIEWMDEEIADLKTIWRKEYSLSEDGQKLIIGSGNNVMEWTSTLTD